ncbi:MAG: thioredoxin family protein [Bacteroidia bacterium]
MMKKQFTIIAVLVSIFILSCKAKQSTEEKIATGYISDKELRNESNNSWFSEGYKNYTPDENIINELNQSDKNLYMLIFAGDWCSDTRYMLPKYYKTADLAGLTNNQLYFLDRNKKSPDKLEENYNITLVPTFIIIKNGAEIGRIEESAAESIEKDLLMIIKK